MTLIVADRSLLARPYHAMVSHVPVAVSNIVGGALGTADDLRRLMGIGIAAPNRGGAQHVIEGPVLEHKHEDVLDTIVEPRAVELARDEDDPQQDTPDEPEDD